MHAPAMPHLDVLSRDELRALLELPAEPCASLFMPIHRAEPARQQNPLRLENLLRRAEERLLAHGLHLPAAQNLLSPGYQLVEDQTFWARQADGLALFAAAELFRIYRLPLAFEELVVVNEHAYISPLLPLLSDDGRFFLLTLGLGGAQLFQGSRYGLSPLPLEGVPASLREALADDEFSKEPQLHAGVPGRGGERGAIFHGQGAKDDTAVKQETLRYFRQVDHGVCHTLGDAHGPLLLAGIASLLPIYREANSYPQLADDAISVNPDTLRPDELHRQAWAFAARQLERDRDAVVERYRRLRGSSPARATGYLRAILPAAFEGRIASLLVARGQQRWGSFNPESRELVVRAEGAAAHDSELLNLAAAQTLLHGGAVYLVAPEQVPEAAPLAALFRY
jgi:hypothetical protein